MSNATPCSMSQKEHKLSREEIENEVNTVIRKYRILMSTGEKVCLYNAAEQSSLFSEDMVLGFYYGLQSKRKPVAVQSSLMNSKQFIEEATKTFKSIMDRDCGVRTSDGRSHLVKISGDQAGKRIEGNIKLLPRFRCYF
ncbi:hypothetical protein ACLB2K_033064 [Fragaria x ananassa]